MPGRFRALEMTMQNTKSIELSQTRGGKWMLRLPEGKSYKQRRMIGQSIGDELHVSRDPDRHFFNRYQGFGFSYDLLSRVPYEILVLHLNANSLFITKRKALKRGKFLNFKKRRLERQIFLSPNDFYQTRTEAMEWDAANPERKYEQENKQMSLFA
jgi:hypothetical protein